MNSYEYALRNFENPTLFQAAMMCRDTKEILVLDSCLSSKRGYHNAIRILSNSDEKNREYWAKSADRWCGWYLEELKQLEGMQ